jgi:hypothetical protein
MPSATRVAFAALVAGVLVAGCGHGEDTRLFITNGTDTTWYLKVKSTSITYVVRVEPGADGLALIWSGGSKVPVELLDKGCQVVGDLTDGGDGTYTVASVPNLSARIEDKPPGYYFSQADGTTFTTDCGGELWTD